MNFDGDCLDSIQFPPSFLRKLRLLVMHELKAAGATNSVFDGKSDNI